MDSDPNGTDTTHTQRAVTTQAELHPSGADSGSHTQRPVTTQADLHPSGAESGTHTQRDWQQQLNSLRTHPAASSGPVPQEPGKVRICGDNTPTDYESDPSHTIANDQPRSHEDELVAADEADDDEVEQTLTPGRPKRQTRKRHASVPSSDTTQTASTSAARPTTTAGREALKASEQQKLDQTSSYYATQIDKRCKDLWQLMDKPPRVAVGRQDDSNEADNYYNNSVAEGLQKTHIARIKHVQREIDGYLVLWSNFENSQTTKKLAQAEAHRRALHLGQRGGYEECISQLQEHICECETQLTYAQSTLQWLDKQRSDDPRLLSGRNSPSGLFTGQNSPIPQGDTIRDSSWVSPTRRQPAHTLSDFTFSEEAASVPVSETLFASSRSDAPIASATQQITQNVSLPNSYVRDSSTSQQSGIVSSAPDLWLVDAVPSSVQATQQHVQKHVRVNPIPTAVYGTPLMTTAFAPPPPHTPPTGNSQNGIADLVLMMQQQAQQQQVLLQQQLQQQAHQQQAQMQQQAQQQQALMQQQTQQQQALMQQCMQPMMQCVQQQQQSQQAIMQMFSKLLKEKETPAPQTFATSSTHTHVGSAQRSQTLAGQPEATPNPTPESSGTGTTFNGVQTEDDGDGGAYENFPHYGGARGGAAHGHNVFPSARGGFSRGRGGTPQTPSAYASPPTHTSQFKLPDPEPFKGDIQDWPRFWEEWAHYVSQTMPDDISKSRLLKKLLHGSAREITTCYRDTAADYRNLVEDLKERYNRPGAMVAFLTRKLQSIRAPEKETAQTLRSFYTQMQAVCRQLKDAGRDVDEPWVTEIIFDKLPEQMLTEISRQLRGVKPEEWTTQRLFGLIKEHVLLAEDIAVRKATKKPAYDSGKLDSSHKRVHAVLREPSAVFEEEDDDTHSNNGDHTVSYDTRTTATDPPAVFNIQLAWPKELLGKRSCPPQMGQRPPKGPYSQQRKTSLPCLFCLLDGQSETSHRSSDCTRFKTWVTRRDLLKDKHHCLRCLKATHTKREKCPKKGLSDQCWQKCHQDKNKPSDRSHHQLLCRVKYPDPADIKQVHCVGKDDGTKGYSSDESDYSANGTDTELVADYGDDPPSDWEDEGAQAYVTHKEETMMAVGTPKRTLMMTAMADLSNVSDMSLRQPCAIFFDPGSSATLITKELARQLDLRILTRSTITFHHFGADPNGRDEETWRVQFNVHLADGTYVRLEADAVDGICNRLPSAPLKDGAIAAALIQPRLAVLTTTVQPQVLIGIDQQHHFNLMPRPKRLPNGFTVWDSRVGPILCGRGKAEPQNKAEQMRTVNFVFRDQPSETSAKIPVRSNAVSEIVAKSPELQAIESMASLEGIGIESPEKVNEEELVLERHRESLTRLADGRYEVSFPYREEILSLLRAGKHPRHILPDNYKPAVARLGSVWKTHLRDNPQGQQAYSNTFEVQLALKIIEQVSHGDDKDLPWLLHYLAHHPVFRADKPTQLRVVFDGSARSGPGTRSLNDCLHPGPSLLESLIGILLRSRGAEILIIGDIEKAFLQIGLRPEDRDVTRFIWLKDASKPPTPDNLVVYRYCRIPFGLNSSPFLLLATIDHHLKQVGSTVSSEIRLNTYSDNVFLLAHTPEEGVAKYKESKLIFSDMKMNIREFISNSSEFSEAIPPEDRAKQTKESTLGHEWDSQRDVWVFRLPEPNPFKRDQEAPAQSSNNERSHEPTDVEQTVMVSRKVKTAKFLTKRVLLSTLHGLWDPLNFLAPLTLQARLVHQELWALDPKLKWDAPVPEPIKTAWEAATSSWSGVSFEIQRHMFSEGRPASLQLHVFVDASADGYGGVAYLRVKTADGNIYTRIAYAKNRVKSRKPVLTIPRKELMAALIGCRMVTFLRKELLPELKRLHSLGDIPVYLWGDNQGVLYWIKDSAHVYGKFVQNRLSEIRSTPNVTFRYVPTKDNPADVLSRGATTYELRSHALWWHGAPWLTEDETQWPEQPSDFQPFSEDLLGADAKVKDVEDAAVHAITRSENRKVSPPLLTALNGAIPADRRSYHRIRRVLAMVVCFVGNCMERRWKRRLTLPLLRSFSPSHTISQPEAFRRLLQYQATELLLVWEAQHSHPPTPTQACQFNVETFPDGLLRCRGRLERGPLAFDTVNPIWLPEKTRVAKHVVLSTHVLNTHAPVETTLALIRRRFWLIKGRRNIRQIIARSCKGCQLVRGPAFRIPDYAQLPLERVSQSRPFAHIGLDLFGPFQVRMGTAKAADLSQPATKRRGRQATSRPSDNPPSDLVKVWGVIFTCMATRAVHLEVTHSQSAEHLMHAMDRFMCCRGHPCSVTSDNAPSIILVNRALAEMWKSTMANPAMQAYARSHSIEWHFITPESPWQGGFYERLIRSVKHCLTASIGRRRLEFSDFTRLLARVAHTLNCRPLTYQSEGDVNAVALRPLDFLQPLAEDTTNMGPVAADMSDPDYTHKLSSEERLIKLYAKQNALLEAFWERWRHEYLLSLRERQLQLKNANRLDRNPQVGEYVLVDDDEPIPRPFWKLARIIALVPGRDGVVRFVKVRFAGGFESERSVERLYPLELWPNTRTTAAEPEHSS